MNHLNGTHLTISDRVKIQELLASNCSCMSIALDLHKDARTISKEIKKRRVKEKNGKFKFGNPQKDFSRSCKRLVRFPYVCNGCEKRRFCTVEFRYFYRAIDAQDHYEFILRDSRIGIDMELADKVHLDNILKEGVDKGQSIQHIVANHSEEIKCSARTIYRWIDKNKTTVQNIDLRRKVRLKPRSKKQRDTSNIALIKGRTYVDFLAYYGRNPGIGIVEMDTVEGNRESDNNCLLTIHFTAFHFMIAFLLENKTKQSVTAVFHKLHSLLGADDFKRLFPLILTDRGVEFYDPIAVEFDANTGEQLTHMFYCNSYSSYQKGAIEENHTLLRYIVPKGTSFSLLSQDKVDLMISHINSYYRHSIGNSPYVLMQAFYGDSILHKLNVRAIHPDDVILRPTLLK